MFTTKHISTRTRAKRRQPNHTHTSMRIHGYAIHIPICPTYITSTAIEFVGAVLPIAEIAMSRLWVKRVVSILHLVLPVYPRQRTVALAAQLTRWANAADLDRGSVWPTNRSPLLL